MNYGSHYANANSSFSLVINCSQASYLSCHRAAVFADVREVITLTPVTFCFIVIWTF